MNEKVLLEMLDIAIGLLNENEICSYCLAQQYGECHLGNSDDYCMNNIFDGLKRAAEERLRNDVDYNVKK